MAWLMAQPTSQTIPQLPETVGVSAVLVKATPGRSDRILSSVSDSVMVVAESDDGTRSECGLLREAGMQCVTFCADFAGGFAAVATSPVVFAEDITEGVMLPTVAGAVPLVDFAEAIAATPLPWPMLGYCSWPTLLGWSP